MFGIVGDGIPRPPDCPGVSIERTHYAARHVDARVVADSRTDDHQIVDDRRRGCFLVNLDLVLRAVVVPGSTDLLLQVDLSAGSEIGAELAVCSVERDETGVNRGDEDASAARLSRPAIRV